MSVETGNSSMFDVQERLRALEHDASATAAAFMSHEKVCAERYKALNIKMNYMFIALLVWITALIFGPHDAAMMTAKRLMEGG
jgi:hypothetical protein